VKIRIHLKFFEEFTGKLFVNVNVNLYEHISNFPQLKGKCALKGYDDNYITNDNI
jgi:hypothetical protein